MTACRHIPASRWPTGGPKGTLSLPPFPARDWWRSPNSKPNRRFPPRLLEFPRACYKSQPSIPHSFFIPSSAIPSLSPQPSAPPFPAAARVSPPLPAPPAPKSSPKLPVPRAAAMSDGKDSLDLSALGAAIPNSAGSLLRLSISIAVAWARCLCLIGLRRFRCRAQRGGQGSPCGVDQGGFSIAFPGGGSLFFCCSFGGLVVGLGGFWGFHSEPTLNRCFVALV